jgi:putative transcriptional regulator
LNTATKLKDEWLLSYAAGALNPGRSLMVSSHLAYHDDLQEAVADAEALGGALLEGLDGSPVSDDALNQLLGKLDDSAVPEIPAVGASGGIFPEPLVEFIDTDIDKLNWRFMGPGMSNSRLWSGSHGERLWLLRAKGGIAIPEHGHTSDEWTLVLNGSYQTELGQYHRGDIEVADDQIDHQPMIDAGEECVCLVYTQGPLQFKSLISRLAQPFIGL